MTAKRTFESFIADALAVHGDKYDYSKAVYVNIKTRMVITCPLHGDFEKAPAHHLAGQGCPACAGKQRYTQESFIAAIRAVHGDRYQYGLTRFSGAQGKVKVYCPEHGIFELKATHHLSGVGCGACAVEASRAARTFTLEQFIEVAQKVHGQRYSYEGTRYTRSIEKVTIHCPEHGAFEQVAASHLSGVGCPGCASFGIWQHEATFLYVLRYGTDLVKVGIASSVAGRLKRLRRASDMPIAVHAIIPIGQGKDAYHIEQAAHQLLAEHHAGLSGFDGSTELFTCSAAAALDAVMEAIDGHAQPHLDISLAG
ncbi:GIY-YIG nuclease family protein [Salmonella enterica subsp. enterica serovar Nigeria]|nr:GIY-YIG nuclease family protein [Salmonella enterica subsp. enterica serovar Nigeria]